MRAPAGPMAAPVDRADLVRGIFNVFGVFERAGKPCTLRDVVESLAASDARRAALVRQVLDELKAAGIIRPKVKDAGRQ